MSCGPHEFTRQAASGPDEAPGNESQEYAGHYDLIAACSRPGVKRARGLALESGGTGHPCHLRQCCCCCQGPFGNEAMSGGRLRPLVVAGD